jgi:hypothetical protein
MIIKYAILLAVVLVLAVIVTWAFLPARHLPGNRARHLRIRLHLRLHPGKGFAHIFSLWLRWSRFAVLRRSGQIRPALPWRYSLLDPREHSGADPDVPERILAAAGAHQWAVTLPELRSEAHKTTRSRPPAAVLHRPRPRRRPHRRELRRRLRPARPR